MIHHINLRDQGSGPKPMSEYQQDTGQALKSLVVYELAYGGFITNLSATEVAVETRLLLGSTIDTTIFRGSTEEMELLVRVAACHSLIMDSQENRTTLRDRAVEFLGSLPSAIGGSPMYVTLLAPFILGGSWTVGALLLAAGVTDPEVMKSLGRIPIEELVDAVAISHETGQPLPEIVEAYGLVPS